MCSERRSPLRQGAEGVQASAEAQLQVQDARPLPRLPGAPQAEARLGHLVGVPVHRAADPPLRHHAGDVAS